MIVTISKTIKWMILLLLGGAAAAGGYAYYFVNRSDEFLRQTMLDRFHEMAPEWNIGIARARFDFQGRIHMYDLSLSDSEGSSTPIVDVAEAIVTVDRDKITEPNPPVRHVRWLKPRVNLARGSDGVWNWQKLAPLHLPKNVVPEFRAEHLALSLLVEKSANGPRTSTSFDDVNLQLIPSGKRQYLVKGLGKFSGAEGLSAEGTWQLDTEVWSLAGQVRSLAIDGALSQLVAEFSPEYRAGRARVDATICKIAGGEITNGPGERGVPAQWLGAPTKGDSPRSADPVARMGLSAAAHVQFHFLRWGGARESEYKVSVHILHGEIKNPPAPFPLRDLRGTIELENRQIVFQELSAQSGETRFKLTRGRVLEQGELRPAELDLEITSLPLDERLPPLFPSSLRNVYLDAQPTGEVDVKAHLESDGRGTWKHESDLVARGCTLAHRKFPYPIEQVEGTITQRGELVDVALTGVAGPSRITMSGRIKNPGPEAASLFVVKTPGIPIDERLRKACPEKFQKVLDQLQARGDLEGRVTLSRLAGLNQNLSIVFDASFRNGSLNCLHFPYPLASVSGEFHGGGDDWEFENFKGRHGAAEITFGGAYHPDDTGEPRLALDFSLTGGTFDRQLLAALPEEQQGVWKEFNPEGALMAAGTVLWSPGEKPRMANLDVKLTDVKLSLRSFPFSIGEVNARISFDGRTATIQSFSGRHEETTIRVNSGFAEIYDDGEWVVHLAPMFVDDLEATPQFRKALPARLWKIIDAFNPRGKQSISGMLEFRGKSGEEYPVTAAWDTVTVYSGTTITAGVDLKEMHGKAFFRGTWDGDEAIGDGRIELNSVKVFGYQLTDIKGPVKIDGTHLVLGSPRQAGTKSGDKAPDSTQRLTARFIEGVLSLDTTVKLTEPMRYSVRMTLEKGDLKRYATLYMPNNQKLAGVMNGSVDLKGEGTNPKSVNGSGTLVIAPAALYELPVIVQILNALSLVPPDNKAFKTARFVFEVGGGLVRFQGIDLIGDAIKLVGHGKVTFDGNVDLQFASRMGSRQLPIPIIRDLINEASKGWVGVSVKGTLKDPHTEIRSFPQLDDALRRLLGVSDMRAPPRR